MGVCVKERVCGRGDVFIDKFFRRLALSIAMLLAVYMIRTAVKVHPEILDHKA